MYDPKIARFLQEDTYTGDRNDPLSLNLYTYCHNEPVMYADPSGHFEKNDELIWDQTTLDFLDLYGSNWDSYNRKAKEYKNKDTEMYDFYIALRNEQHDKAESARADFVAKYAGNPWVGDTVEKYVLAKSGRDIAMEIADISYDLTTDETKRAKIHAAMHIKMTDDIMPNERLLLSAQGKAREGLDNILGYSVSTGIISSFYGGTFDDFSFGTKYARKMNSAITSNFVWQTFAFVGGIYLDVNNPAASAITGPSASNEIASAIIDYSSTSISNILINEGEPGGSDFLNAIDPFKHAKEENKARLKAAYVNNSEYKYLLTGDQGCGMQQKFIGRVEEYKNEIKKRNFKYGNKTQSSVYKKLVLEYLDNVINENKNHDASVAKLDNEFEKIFK